MLATLANLAQVVGALAVLAAFIFGLIQIRQYQEQRRDAVAVELMRAMQDTEFTNSFRLLTPLPVDLSAADLRSRGESYERAALVMGTKFETLGFLVFRGTMPLALLEELVGGVCVHIWVRLRPWVFAIREEQGQPLFLEWFQWLAERLQARGRPKATPAFVRYASWTPT
jgi:hypothetical protein